MIRVTLLLAMLGGTAACLRSNPATEMYVCTDPSMSVAFTPQLAAILRTASFTPKLGRSVLSRETIFVLEARKTLIRIWAQNMPVDPPNDVADLNTGVWPLIDPNQYVVSVQSWEPRLQSPKPVFDHLRSELIRAGFRVHHGPDRCSEKRPLSTHCGHWIHVRSWSVVRPPMPPGGFSDARRQPIRARQSRHWRFQSGGAAMADSHKRSCRTSAPRPGCAPASRK